ncbi:unnamed protein product [Ixodes hexagonus]
MEPVDLSVHKERVSPPGRAGSTPPSSPDSGDSSCVDLRFNKGQKSFTSKLKKCSTTTSSSTQKVRGLPQ